MSLGRFRMDGQPVKERVDRNRPLVSFILLILLILINDQTAVAEGPDGARARARDLGIVIGRYQPGPRNAITDIAGIKVGHVTLVYGEGKLIPGKGPVRIGRERPPRGAARGIASEPMPVPGAGDHEARGNRGG